MSHASHGTTRLGHQAITQDLHEKGEEVGGEAREERQGAGEEREERGEGEYGHAGMVEAADRVFALLHVTGLLPTLLSTFCRFHAQACSPATPASSDEGGGDRGKGRDAVYRMLGMSEDEVYVADGILEGGGESRDVALPSSAPGVVGAPPSPPSHLNASASPPTQYRGFGVVLVGHSLGAGVVSLLSMQLKATAHECYTSLDCIALSPPPTLSPAAAAAGRRYITTVVVEDDLVSRLSLRSLQLLRVSVTACECIYTQTTDLYSILIESSAISCNLI